MSRIKTKSIVWYYFKHFLYFYAGFLILEIIAGALIYLTNINDDSHRDLLYDQWRPILLGLQNIGWFFYLLIVNYRAGDKFGLRAFSGIWIWVVCYGPFFFYDLLNYSILDFIIIKVFITLFTLPMIFIGSYKRKMDMKRFNEKRGLSPKK